MLNFDIDTVLYCIVLYCVVLYCIVVLLVLLRLLALLLPPPLLCCFLFLVLSLLLPRLRPDLLLPLQVRLPRQSLLSALRARAQEDGGD